LIADSIEFEQSIFGKLLPLSKKPSLLLALNELKKDRGMPDGLFCV